RPCIERAIFAGGQRSNIQFCSVIKQSAATIGRHFENLAIVTGAQINISLRVDCARPDKCLLGVEYLVETRRQHQHLGVAYRDSARVPLQQISPATSFPDDRLSGISSASQNCKQENRGSNAAQKFSRMFSSFSFKHVLVLVSYVFCVERSRRGDFTSAPDYRSCILKNTQ